LESGGDRRLQPLQLPDPRSIWAGLKGRDAEATSTPGARRRSVRRAGGTGAEHRGLRASWPLRKRPSARSLRSWAQNA